MQRRQARLILLAACLVMVVGVAVPAGISGAWAPSPMWMWYCLKRRRVDRRKRLSHVEMSCPYFYPVEPRASTAILPLGDRWAGVCRAVADLPWQPEEAIVGRLCNLGYARGTCARFPSGEGPDAVRFTVSGDQGASLRIDYVLERDHHPFAHGPLHYSVASAAFVDPPAGETMRRQAQAYVESYLRRKGRRDRVA